MSAVDRLKEALGLKVALIQGPMGGVAGPGLVSAVANCGALGVLPIWAVSLESAKDLIKRTQAATILRFAVNLRSDLNQLDHIAISADLGIDTFHLFWGDPSVSSKKIRALKGKFICTVGDTEAAKLALDSGASALVAQGVEAGGHVLSEIPLSNLLSAVLEIAGDVPVIAAGGIVDASDAGLLIEQGAGGVLCGSRFVASDESDAHEQYKAAIVVAGENATVRSVCFDLGWPDAPHRTLRNSTFQMWAEAGFPEMGNRPGEQDLILVTQDKIELHRYSVVPPKVKMKGNILAAATYSGTGVHKIKSIMSVRQIVGEFAKVLC